MYVVGLTGGIGSGKTTAASLFQELRIHVVDCDVIARTLVDNNSSLREKIIFYFGEKARQGMSLDRAYIRKKIFEDKIARSYLENLLHPLIIEEAKYQIAQTQSGYCLLVIPLLVEHPTFTSAFHLNRILVIDIPENLQIERLLKRDNISLKDARCILETQASRSVRLAKADDIIVNKQNISFLKKTIIQLHNYYLKASQA